MTRPPDRMRRVQRNDLARDQPIEQHADAGKMLLDRRRRHFAAQLLDIASHMHRLHILQPVNALRFAPLQERSGSAGVGLARVLVADVDGKKIDETLSRTFSRLSDEYRQKIGAAVWLYDL